MKKAAAKGNLSKKKKNEGFKQSTHHPDYHFSYKNQQKKKNTSALCLFTKTKNGSRRIP